jgi:hypothetical protein
VPLPENFKVFFNEDEHAVPATFKTPEGALVREASVILSLPVQEMQVGPGQGVEQLQPSVQCPTADVEGVKKNYVVEVGGGTFRVVRRESDGTGLTTVWLRKEIAG